ncbi:MAG: type II toxin-antitoxin system HicB family antitoxin [Coriobacteriales bacterium]|jgi:excisionase family DNA binding protein|nr:type II toxin-antitoxin system HicB family antitoxin [Coriobacteriales bacterium]
MRRYVYEAVLTPSEAGYLVCFPDLDKCTQGESLEDAVYMAADLLELILEGMLKDGSDIPAPTYGRSAGDGGYVIAISASPDLERDEGSVTTGEAAIMLGLSDSRVRAMVRDGVLASEKVGRDRLIPVWSIRERFENPRGSGRPRKELAAV